MTMPGPGSTAPSVYSTPGAGSQRLRPPAGSASPVTPATEGLSPPPTGPFGPPRGLPGAQAPGGAPRFESARSGGGAGARLEEERSESAGSEEEEDTSSSHTRRSRRSSTFNLRGSLRDRDGGDQGGGGDPPGPDGPASQQANDLSAAFLQALKSATSNRDPRVTLDKAPDLFEEYPNWRFGAQGAILKCGIRALKAMAYIRSLDVLPDEALLVSGDDEDMLQLDIQLFGALTSSLAKGGKRQARYSTIIQAEVPFGAGRAAFRRLDRLYRFEGTIRATYVATHLVKLSTAGCDNMGEVGPHITGIRTDLHILAAAHQPSPPSMTLQLLKDALAKVTEVAATMAQFETIPEQDQTPEELLREALRQPSSEEGAQGRRPTERHAGAHSWGWRPQRRR